LSYAMSAADWSSFLTYLEAEGFAYSTESMEVLEELRNVVELEQYDAVAKTPIENLRAALEPNLKRDLDLFETEIRQTLEEEVVLRFHYAAGMVERSLTMDPTVDRALAVFGDEMSEVIGWGQTDSEASGPSRE